MTHRQLNCVQPPLWLIVFIAGMPLFSETVYSPALPNLAEEFRITDALAEWTFTIYLIGFAIGVFFWGRLSDHWGRKNTLLTAFSVYLIGCIGCYLSPDIQTLMGSRLIQALGASAGSVLAQAITRDAFHGPSLGKAYAIVMAALSIFPAIGPVIGGMMNPIWGWRSIFLAQCFSVIFLLLFIAIFLGETHHKQHRQKSSLLQVAARLISDKNVVGYAFLVAGVNGIFFSYCAEGPFFMIEWLGVSTSVYGFLFGSLALGSFLGGVINRLLHERKDSQFILNLGLIIITLSTALFLGGVTLLSKDVLVYVTPLFIFIMVIGNAMIASNSLSLALVDYRDCIGTASSLFGFGYYIIISLITFGMGLLHQDEIGTPMPAYFFGISVLMFIMYKGVIQPKQTQ